MKPELRGFVEMYKKKKTRPITVREWIKNPRKRANHEIWRKCSNCGAYNDLRKTDYCEDCNEKLK